MAKLYSWEFRTSPSCYAHQNMFGSKNMFSKMLLFLATFIHILSKSSSLSNYISINNAEYPGVMSSSSVKHYKRTGVQERECFSGRLCEYRISESDFLCKVQTYVISKKAERFLPEWLWFNEEKRTLLGIPSEKDEGICDILIIGLTKLPNHPAGHICGSVTIKITVWGLNNFPLFAQNSLLRVKIRGNSDGQINACAFNEPIILASLVLSSNIVDLKGEKRWEFIEALSSSYDISIQNTFVLPNTVQNPFLNLLESSHVVASGPGANRSASGPSILLTWHVKCGVIQLDDPLFEQLKQLSQKWSRTKNISYGIIGWHVITGFQNHYVKLRRRRRNVIGGSTTLVHSTIPISRATIVTTKLKPNKTSYRSQTATLTRPLPSPTFSSPVGSSSLLDVFSSTQRLDQINSSSSQYSIGNSSSEVLRSRNVSMISQFSSSAKRRTSIQPSSTSTQIQRSTTYILLPSSIHLISSSGYGTASNEFISSTEFTSKISTISSFLRSRDTNSVTSFTMRFSSNISRSISNSSYLKTTLYPSVISSNSTFKILDTAIFSTLALNRSTELLSFTKKYLSSLKSNFLRTTSALQQSRTYLTTSQDFVSSRTTRLSVISGIAADTTILVKTINQSRSARSSSTVRRTQPPSIVSTHVLLASSQSYNRTASNPIYTVDFSSTPMLHTDISSTTPMLNKTSRAVRSLILSSSVIHQTKTVVSFQSHSATLGVNVTSWASRTIMTSTINRQRETATRQLVTYSSKFNLNSSTDDTAIKKGSTVTSTQSMSTGFSLQTSVKDETTFSKTLIQTSRKMSQFQGTVLSTSSKYMVSDFIKTTTATRFKPVQSSSATSVTVIKEISSVLTSMKDKATFSKTLMQTSSKTSPSEIIGKTTATSFKPVQLSSTSVIIRSKGISSSRVMTVSRDITDTMSTTNFTETTFVSPMPSSVVKTTSSDLTTVASSSIEPSTATAEISRSALNSTTLRILPSSSTPLLSPSLLKSYFDTAALTSPTEQITSTSFSSYFIKEPSSTPLLTPTSVQTNTVSSSIETDVIQSPLLSVSSSSTQRLIVRSSSSPPSSLFRSFVLSGSSSSSLPPSSLRSVVVSGSSLSPPPSSSHSVVVSSPSPSPPSSSLQSVVVTSPSSSRPSSSLQSLVVSSPSPSPPSSSLQSVVVSSPSPSPPSSSLQSVVVSSPSPSPPSSSLQSVVVSSPSPSPPSSSLQSVVVSSPSPSPPSSSLQSLVVSSPSPSPPSSSLQSLVVSSPSPSRPSSSLQSVVVSSPSPSPPSSSLQSPVVSILSPSPPSSSLQSLVVSSPSPPSSSLQSVVVSILSPSPPSSSLQSVVVSSPSPSLPSSSLQSVVVSILSPSPPSSSLQSPAVSSPSPPSSSLQSVVISSPSPSPPSSSFQSPVVSILSPSPPSNSLQSMIVSSPSPPSSSLQSLVVTSPSPSPPSSSFQSVVVTSPSSSPPSSSLQSLVVSILSPSPPSSSLQSLVVTSPSSSPPSSSLQSVVVPSPSPSLPSSSLQSVVISSLSPSPPSSSLQSVVVSSPSPSPPSSSLQSVVVTSPSSSSPPSSSLQSLVVSSPSPSPPSSSLQSVVVSSPSPSPPSSSLQSVVVSSPSPSPPSSSFQSPVVSILSPSPPSSSLQSMIVSSPSPSPPSSSLQSVVVSSPSPSPPSSSFQSPVVSILSPSPPSSSLQSMIISSPSPPSSSLQSVVVTSPSSSPPSSSLQSLVVSSPSPSPPSRSLQSVVVSSPSPSPPSSSLQSVVVTSPSPSPPSGSLQSVVVSSPSPSPPSSSLQSAVISSSSPQLTLLSSLWSTVQSMSPLTLPSSDQSLLDRRSPSPTTSRFFHSFVKQSSSPFTLSQSSTFYSSTLSWLSPQVKQTSDVSSSHLSLSHKSSSVYFMSSSIVTTHSSSFSLTSTKPAVTSSDFSFSSVLSTISSRYSSFSTTVPDTTSIKSQTSISEPDIALHSSSASPSSSSIVPFPTTPPNNSPKLYNSFDLLVVTVGKVFSVEIPIDTFHDREDGNTRNLFLSCLDSNHGTLSRSSWLQFNTTTQILYGVVLASQVEQIKTSSEYLLVAEDRNGNKAYDAFTIDVRNNEGTLAVSFSVKIMRTNVEMFNQDLSNILLLVQKIADYYGDKDESLIRVMSVKDGSVVVTWGNATVQTCNEDIINELTSRIVTTEGNIQPGFYNTLLPTFLAEDVYRNRTGPCISEITTEKTGDARISSHDDSTWLKYFLPGLIVALLIIIVAVTCFVVRRHSGVKILKADKRTFKRRKPIILDEELEMSTLSGKPIELPDDSLTPIRYPKETALTNHVYDGSDDEDFPEWSSPILPAPSYLRLPPKYGSNGDNYRYKTPPPPYKLPPSY